MLERPRLKAMSSLVSTTNSDVECGIMDTPSDIAITEDVEVAFEGIKSAK